jgi:hypothetical protein
LTLVNLTTPPRGGGRAAFHCPIEGPGAPAGILFAPAAKANKPIVVAVDICHCRKEL